MDPLGRNKIMAAILGAGLIFMMVRSIPEFVSHEKHPKVPAYVIGELEVSDEEEIELPFPQPEWIAAMDADRGASVFRKCASCHNVDKGGRNSTGPALYGIVGDIMGQKPGFSYSAAMANAGIAWNYEDLDAFLERPSAYMSGTKMNFVGLRKPEDRAAVIEYLRVADDNPEPRPAPAPSDIGPELEEIVDSETVTVPAGETTIENPLDDVTEADNDEQ